MWEAAWSPQANRPTCCEILFLWMHIQKYSSLLWFFCCADCLSGLKPDSLQIKSLLGPCFSRCTLTNPAAQSLSFDLWFFLFLSWFLPLTWVQVWTHHTLSQQAVVCTTFCFHFYLASGSFSSLAHRVWFQNEKMMMMMAKMLGALWTQHIHLVLLQTAETN